MSKNIVVFSDGTGQEGGTGVNSNVYRLFNMVVDRSPDQIAFYDRGLGTGWRRITGSVAGMGISRNILECYEFLFDNFESGDEIYLFGFSRGAATVRSLTGLLHLFGILPKSRPELLRRAYRIYKTRERAKRERAAEDFVRRHHTMWCKVRFLGVWDTVAALGLPIRTLSVLLDRIPWFRHSFHDLRLSESVVHARQALAIDDERRIFHPLLWDADIGDGQTVKQVWFCGMHTDVGGGYEKHQLSDLALEWMTREAVQHGLLLWPYHAVRTDPDPNGWMHDSRAGLPWRLYRRARRTWPPGRGDKPLVHASVTERTRNAQNTAEPPYAPWILAMEHEIEPVRAEASAPPGLATP